MTLRRLLAGSIVVLATLGGACILGPKQDDPTADNGPGTGDSGPGADAASSDGFVPRDSGTGGVDAPHSDTTPTSDVGFGDTSSDAVPMPDGDAAGDTSATDAPLDGEDALDDGAADGGSAGDGAAE